TWCSPLVPPARGFEEALRQFGAVFPRVGQGGDVGPQLPVPRVARPALPLRVGQRPSVERSGRGSARRWGAEPRTTPPGARSRRQLVRGASAPAEGGPAARRRPQKDLPEHRAHPSGPASSRSAPAAPPPAATSTPGGPRRRRRRGRGGRAGGRPGAAGGGSRGGRRAAGGATAPALRGGRGRAGG